MSNDERSTTDSSVPGFSRRSVLKATGAATVGAALFTGTASATDEPAIFEIECLGDTGKVTLKSIDGMSPVSLLDSDFHLYVGKESEVAPGNASDGIDAIAEIASCYLEEYDYKADECPSPVAHLNNPDKPGDGSLVYTFDLSDAGLDGVTSKTSVVVAGLYQDPDGNLKKPATPYQSFDSLEQGRVYFDPATCCVECDTDGLLAKWEATDEDGDGIEESLVLEEDGDENIELKSVTLDDEGEIKSACFTTKYCTLEAIVKAGPESSDPPLKFDVEEDGTTFCVDADFNKFALSNVAFYCEAPDEVKGRGR